MLENYEALITACKKYNPTMIVHLAAQAGVRYSINNPRSYVNSNLIGTFNILELSKFLRLNIYYYPLLHQFMEKLKACHLRKL